MNLTGKITCVVVGVGVTSFGLVSVFPNAMMGDSGSSRATRSALIGITSSVLNIVGGGLLIASPLVPNLNKCGAITSMAGIGLQVLASIV